MPELENCQQVDIPEVDNTSLECDEFYNALCVLVETTYPYLGITTSGKSVKEILDAIVDKLKTQSALITKNSNDLAAIEGASFVVKTRTSDYTALVTDNLIFTDGADITLFASGDVLHPITIKNNGTTPQLIIRSNTDTIEGNTTLTLIAGASVTLYPSGTDFKLI